jgi:hypothetical protein
MAYAGCMVLVAVRQLNWTLQLDTVRPPGLHRPNLMFYFFEDDRLDREKATTGWRRAPAPRQIVGMVLTKAETAGISKNSSRRAHHHHFGYFLS